MERLSRPKGSTMVSYLSKAGTFSVSNPPHSPSRRSERGFSGPIVSIIPKEARRRNRGDSVDGAEPSSPKISCMGQIKPKRKKGKILLSERKKEDNKESKKREFCFCFSSMFRRRVRPGETPEVQEKKKKSATPASGLSKIRRYQSGRETLGDFDWTRNMEGNHGDEEVEKVFTRHSAPLFFDRGSIMSEQKASKPASGLSNLMRYQSGREKLGDFDWTIEMEENHSDDENGKAFIPHSEPKPTPGLSKVRQYQSGREMLKDFDWRKTVEENHGDEMEKVLIPHSAPMMILAGEVAAELEPKKEVNLWRRRETSPPIPLQIEKI